jgi:hypothetical protein
MLKLDDRRGSPGACNLRALVAGGALLLAACVYDVPTTRSATRRIDAGLLGDWRSADRKTLTAYAVNSETIPKTLRTSGAVRKFLRQNNCESEALRRRSARARSAALTRYSVLTNCSTSSA